MTIDTTTLNGLAGLNATAKMTAYTNILKQVQQAKEKSADLDQAIQTYNQEFVNRADTFVVGNSGIQTMQDKILIFFFAAYLFLVIMLSFSFATAAKNDIVGLGLATLLIIFGVMIAALIRNYG